MAKLSILALNELEGVVRPAGRSKRGRKPIEKKGSDSGAGGHSSHDNRERKALAALKRITQRTPEVFVRRTGKQKDGGHTAANLLYISRLSRSEDTEVELVHSEARPLQSWSNIKALAEQWEGVVHNGADRRKGPVSNSLVFSLPAGTDGKAVLEATIEPARRELPNQEWVAALHKDTEHVHVHLTVCMRDRDMKRTWLPAERLSGMREVFAEELRARGIEANASSRKARGVARKSEPFSGRKGRERTGEDLFKDKTVKKLSANRDQRSADDPIDQRTKKVRRKVLDVYKSVSLELIKSPEPEDKKLAVELALYSQKMPPPLSHYGEIRQKANILRAERMKQAAEAGLDRPHIKPDDKDKNDGMER